MKMRKFYKIEEFTDKEIEFRQNKLIFRGVKL